jgi:hypothetical protein
MFRMVCSLTAVIAMALFGLLLILPGHYTAGYGVTADVGGMFMGRRASPLFLGLAILLWMVRDEVEPNIQRAVSLSMIGLFAGVACTGIWSFASGLGNTNILLAALGEYIIALAFFIAMRRR